jgi:hypothetical protein
VSLAGPAILAGGYVGGFLLGSYVLRAVLRFVDPFLRERVSAGIDFRDVGTWIGLCEHVLIVTFVLADEYTSIGLIFAAKELVRADKVREQPSYYLLGTLLNLALAVVFGTATRLLLAAPFAR